MDWMIESQYDHNASLHSTQLSVCISSGCAHSSASTAAAVSAVAIYCICNYHATDEAWRDWLQMLNFQYLMKYWRTASRSCDDLITLYRRHNATYGAPPIKHTHTNDRGLCARSPRRRGRGPLLDCACSLYNNRGALPFLRREFRRIFAVMKNWKKRDRKAVGGRTAAAAATTLKSDARRARDVASNEQLARIYSTPGPIDFRRRTDTGRDVTECDARIVAVR